MDSREWSLARGVEVQGYLLVVHGPEHVRLRLFRRALRLAEPRVHLDSTREGTPPERGNRALAVTPPERGNRALAVVEF